MTATRAVPLPDPPVGGLRDDIEAWLAHPSVDAAFLADDVRFSVVLSATNLPPGRQDVDEFWNGVVHLSWLGGPAVAPLEQWPRRGDGTSLAHVASLHLGELSDVVQDHVRSAWGSGMPARHDPAQSLPDTGVLEIFHDCETTGLDVGRVSHGAWLVRWVQRPGQEVVEPPDDVPPTSVTCQVVIPFASFTVPAASDTGVQASEARDRVHAVHDALLGAWGSQPHEGSGEARVPVSHAYGHSCRGLTGIRDVLDEALPPDVGDEHVLLVELVGEPHLREFFGDGRHLEVWIRRSDLAERRFDRVWCLTRTG
jgi:hypothetical protein